MLWTELNLPYEALKYTTRTDFANHSGSAYNAARRLKILDKICAHMIKTRRIRSIEWAKQELCKYSTRIELKKKDPSLYNFVIKNKPLESTLDGIPKNKKEHTIDEIFSEGLKYTTRNDFKNNSSGVYQAALARGILDKVCSHMPKHVDQSGENASRFKWTREKLQEEAKQYTTRTDFARNSSGAYHAACILNIIDDICTHMVPIFNTSRSEQSLFDLIKREYPKTQKFRARKVNIEGHPQIQGFDIDIYIPELRKGIEFDGDYWHSVKGLKRSRVDWPEEDLENYHKIKDQYFLSKGIQILHIKEADWIKNKENCIRICLQFLDCNDILNRN